MKIPNNVLQFAAGNLKPYEQFIDYWKNYRSLNGATGLDYDKTVSFAEKEEKMNATLLKEIMRVSGIQGMENLPKEAWITNPQFTWATFAIVNSYIDMILPDVLIDSIGLYSDVRSGGWGDSFSFEIESRDLFAVSKSGKAQKSVEMHKQFKGLVTIVPEMHEISVQVSLMRVLQGKESLAAFVMKAARSLEAQLTLDTYTAFATAMAALPTTATTGLKTTGFTSASLVDKCQRVSAWSGQRAVIVGTQLALANILPDDANYRYDISSDFVKVGFVKEYMGYPTLVLPQLANWTTPWGTLISDNYLWILAPSSQKIVKVCLEGSTLSNTTGTFENANLTQSTTIFKSWGIGVATNTTAATIQLA
jgi:hypothetical protein